MFLSYALFPFPGGVNNIIENFLRVVKFLSGDNSRKRIFSYVSEEKILVIDGVILFHHITTEQNILCETYMD